NPASSQITISQIFNYNALGQAQQPKPITTIRLVDQMGVTMMTQNFQGAQTSVVLNISSLQKGIYLLKINETEGHTLIKE
ncbi:MAG: T9SS type A sorting domain-containing protein, partial [Bacteroidales bacterium]|nr:T9SS type A sorting domain-containing protein [Bacteroidales bacterium]